jgi:GTP pyrophosphokinase
MEYTPEDERLIAEKFDELLRSCEKIIKQPEDWDTIKRAFHLAKDAHKGVRRRSGAPYITHPIAVAMIVVDEIGLGVKSVAAALLHDVVEDNIHYEVSDIENMFGPKIASMVDGLTKIAGVFVNQPGNTPAAQVFSSQAETFRKVLLSLSDDARVILIKIADRLHNMRTLGWMPAEKQIKITSETLFLFAPLAYRLGLYAIKTELEDLCLKYRFPATYDEIEGKLSATAADRDEFIERFIAPIRLRLRESGIDFKIEGRVKSIYSIWSKMQRKQVSFDEIYDLFAIRVVFNPSPIIPEKSQCWHIYSLITDIYQPRPDRLRDWISSPKTNGYEALHAMVMGPGGRWVEVQIRSERMDKIAEMGFAAHWKYKRADGQDSDESEFDKSLQELRDVLNTPNEDAIALLDNFKLTLYSNEIVVFTPKGESRKLPKGATALDFAYAIHTNVGDQAIGAKINHKIEPITHLISSGDQIEILTSRNSRPRPEWLDHVATAKARQAITTYLKGDVQTSVRDGIRLFEEKLREFGVKPSGSLFRKVLPAYNAKTKDEFYSKLGSGMINLGEIESVLQQNSASKMLKFWTIESVNPFRRNQDKQRQEHAKKVRDAEGAEGDKYAIAPCCNPVPGDEIIGYDNPETGRTDVHKISCEELTRLAASHGERIKSIEWASHKAMSHFAKIELRGIDRIGIMLDVSMLIAGELNINIRELNIRTHDGVFEGTISVYVKGTNDINSIIDKAKKIKGIESVKRLNS